MSMLDAKRQAEVDQSVKMLTENLPPMFKGLYDGLVKEGFTEAQAMELTKAYIVGFVSARV